MGVRRNWLVQQVHICSVLDSNAAESVSIELLRTGHILISNHTTIINMTVRVPCCYLNSLAKS